MVGREEDDQLDDDRADRAERADRILNIYYFNNIIPEKLGFSDVWKISVEYVLVKPNLP